MLYFFFFKQKTAYEMRISDWSSDVCSSDLDILRRNTVSQTTALPNGSSPPAASRRNVMAHRRRSGARSPSSAPARPDTLQGNGYWWTAAGTARPSEPLLPPSRSEEQTSELQSLMRTSYAGFCLK